MQGCGEELGWESSRRPGGARSHQSPPVLQAGAPGDRMQNPSSHQAASDTPINHQQAHVQMLPLRPEVVPRWPS